MKIINSILVGIACCACTPSDFYTLRGTLPENSNATEVYLLSKEGKALTRLQEAWCSQIGLLY